MVKNAPINAGDTESRGFNARVGKNCWSKLQPAPVFLPGKSHRQRRLVGYSPWSCKESDKPEHSTQLTSIDYFIQQQQNIHSSQAQRDHSPGRLYSGLGNTP